MLIVKPFKRTPRSSAGQIKHAYSAMKIEYSKGVGEYHLISRAIVSVQTRRSVTSEVRHQCSSDRVISALAMLSFSTGKFGLVAQIATSQNRGLFELGLIK